MAALRAQTEAFDAFDALANDPALHFCMEFRAGDIQLVCNHSLLHDRTAFEDWPDPRRKRHLLRLWLSTPQDEGGWKLPFGDANQKKRGGIQVDDQPPVAPLDAE